MAKFYETRPIGLTADMAISIHETTASHYDVTAGFTSLAQHL